MKKKFNEYKTIIFDCDGVILNSNKIKSDAFYYSALPYGSIYSNKLVEYHVLNGGVSRYSKFEWFCRYIIFNYSNETYDKLLKRYNTFLKEAYQNIEVNKSLLKLKESSPSTNWCVVSGSDENELRDLFDTLKIKKLFNKGIFGSPQTKSFILNREIETHNIDQNSLFIGDSVLDYNSASEFKIDFLFMSDWTEVENWKDWVASNQITNVPDLSYLL